MLKATRESFGDALLALGETNPNLVVLDADLSKSTMTQAFMKKFPARHFEVGIAEQNMVGMAAGLALSGKTPVLASFACFLIGRLETIRVSAAYNQTNVKLVGTHAGIGIGEDGTSQMGLEDVAAMRALPHMTVLQPADDTETKQAVAWMVEHKGPVYLRLTRQKMPDVHGADYKWQPNKIDILWEPAKKPAKYQATIIASGGPVPHAVEAAKSLDAKGFAVRVANASTLAPFDNDAISRFGKDSQRFVTVEDHNVNGGLGSAVCEAAAERGLGVPTVRLGMRDFGESATPDQLYEKYGFTAPSIAEACLKNL
ncbi:MAG TPA: transketolase C-terminal domain-containing protein [Elusimicrobiota bacterium]|jgi:transketolase|nr:transketolase C-terminal domain-containing protein [Elusimicrobiota bacterium]